MSKHRATKVSKFEPVEVSLNAVRSTRQNDLTVGDYYNSMMDNIDDVTDKRVIALGVGMATGTYPSGSTIPYPYHQKKFYPSGYPYILAGIKSYPYPYPRGYFYPSGNPYPLGNK
jgi:hypothetical protein